MMRFLWLVFFLFVYGCSLEVTEPHRIPSPVPPPGLCEFIEVSTEDKIMRVEEKDCSLLSEYIVFREIKRGYIVRKGIGE